MDLVHKKIPLSVDNSKLYIVPSNIPSIVEELEDFLRDNSYMNSKMFSENVLFSQEIKNNNTIEDYNDDVGLIYDILKNNKRIKDTDKTQRIKNLYNGYKYILNDKEITKDNLKELYTLLSNDLLDKEDKFNMGQYYRNNNVYIYYSDNMEIEPDKGIDPIELNKYMEELFNYVNSNNNFNCNTDYFIKSQIMHFQFVNIHPYYDINGRTARTVSMWYLLNNKIYPYIIFNRAIVLDKKKYYKIIRDVKEYHNITFFINYMLENVKIELEKEYIMDMIKSNSSKLSAVDYQTMYYILSMNSNLSVKDFTNFYNHHNDKKRLKEIYQDMLESLLDKGIILKERNTKSHINSTDNNFIFKLNESKYELDPNKVKRLKINK